VAPPVATSPPQLSMIGPRAAPSSTLPSSCHISRGATMMSSPTLHLRREGWRHRCRPRPRAPVGRGGRGDQDREPLKSLGTGSTRESFLSQRFSPKAIKILEVTKATSNALSWHPISLFFQRGRILRPMHQSDAHNYLLYSFRFNFKVYKSSVTQSCHMN
jgi:hypothetical protein